jgi:hypothetical protein
MPLDSSPYSIAALAATSGVLLLYSVCALFIRCRRAVGPGIQASSADDTIVTAASQVVIIATFFGTFTIQFSVSSLIAIDSAENSVEAARLLIIGSFAAVAFLQFAFVLLLSAYVQFDRNLTLQAALRNQREDVAARSTNIEKLLRSINKLRQITLNHLDAGFRATIWLNPTFVLSCIPTGRVPSCCCHTRRFALS